MVPNPNPKAADSCEDYVHVEEKGERVTERCKVVITDLMDHSCLGFGLLSSIDHVGANLAAPDAVVRQAAWWFARRCSRCGPRR